MAALTIEELVRIHRRALENGDAERAPEVTTDDIATFLAHVGVGTAGTLEEQGAWVARLALTLALDLNLLHLVATVHQLGYLRALADLREGRIAP